jgi:hypothetical protein
MTLNLRGIYVIPINMIGTGPHLLILKGILYQMIGVMMNVRYNKKRCTTEPTADRGARHQLGGNVVTDAPPTGNQMMKIVVTGRQ